ncbi:MAG: ABC transporter permease [Bacillota bacterium]
MRFLPPHGRLALGVILLVVMAACLAPVLSPWDPGFQDRSSVLELPGPRHPFGTDHLGRDTLSRLLWGSRISLTVGVFVSLFSSLVGAAVGLPSGYYGGAIDGVAMRVMEVFAAFPNILLAIALMSAFGPGLAKVVLALTLAGFAGASRLARSEALRLSCQEFVMAARVSGTSDARIILIHILPNSLGPLLVYATSSLGWWVAAEAGLSFLGLAAHPSYPSWGTMIAEAVPFMRTRPLLLWAPCLLLSTVVLGLAFLGDVLESNLSPKSMARPARRGVPRKASP